MQTTSKLTNTSVYDGVRGPFRRPLLIWFLKLQQLLVEQKWIVYNRGCVTPDPAKLVCGIEENEYGYYKLKYQDSSCQLHCLFFMWRKKRYPQVGKQLAHTCHFKKCVLHVEEVDPDYNVSQNKCHWLSDLTTGLLHLICNHSDPKCTPWVDRMKSTSRRPRRGSNDSTETYAMRRRSLRTRKTLQKFKELDEDFQEEDYEEDEEEFMEAKPKRRKGRAKNGSSEEWERPKRAPPKKKPPPTEIPVHQPKKPTFNPKLVSQMASKYPDTHWNRALDADCIEFINRNNPITLQKSLPHPGAVYGLSLSPDYNLLATCSNLGTIRLWDTSTWNQICELKDEEEKNIEELYHMQWSDDSRHLITAGKMKSRVKWSEEDDDNCIHTTSSFDLHTQAILPCPVKIFSVLTGKVVARLEGHAEEVLCLKKIVFKGKNYLVTSSEDGRIIKWRMSDDWSSLIEWVYVDDLTTYVAVSLSFLSRCGNKYFVCGGDDGIKLFDFEAGLLVETWKDMFSYLCDCVKVIEPSEIEPTSSRDHFVLSKGVELLSDTKPDEVMYPNKVILSKLVMPRSSAEKWKLVEVARFSHEGFEANRWLLRLTSNGRYVLAPTTVGRVFVWNLRTKELTAVLKGHAGEIRDVLFHPTKRLMLTCGDDSKINIYTQQTKYDIQQITKEEQEQLEEQLMKKEEELLKIEPIPRRLRKVKENKDREAESEYDLKSGESDEQSENEASQDEEDYYSDY